MVWPSRAGEPERWEQRLPVEAMKEQALAVKAKHFGCYTKNYDFEVGKLRDNPTSGHITKIICSISGKFLAYSEDSFEIYNEIAHSRAIVVNSLGDTNLLKLSNMCAFFIC